jgi:hypothetical protein
MPMSKKHYTAIASELSTVLWEKHTDPATVARVIAGIARVCEEDNPRFDKARFVAAATAPPSTK